MRKFRLRCNGVLGGTLRCDEPRPARRGNRGRGGGRQHHGGDEGEAQEDDQLENSK